MTDTTNVRANRPPGAGLFKLLDRYLLYVYTAFAILYLMLPVAVMALFSVNDPPGRSNVALGESEPRRGAEQGRAGRRTMVGRARS